MGDPTDPATQIGPIANRPQFEKILSYIKGAKEEGATCVAGGNAVDGPECGQGLFIEPTVFTNVTSSMKIAREEVFGPVLAVMTFDDEDEAVSLANDTISGLAAGETLPGPIVWRAASRAAQSTSTRTVRSASPRRSAGAK